MIVIFVKILIDKRNEIVMLKLQNFEALNKVFEKNHYFINCYLIIDVTIINVENVKKFFAKINKFFIIKFRFRITMFKEHHN